MSMIGQFAAISEEQLQALQDDPDAVESFLYPGLRPGKLPNQMDVDKAWHGIHFLLTGEAWSGAPPLGLAVLGGTEIGEDLGYGPARYLTPDQAAEVAQALAAMPRSALEARYSPAAFQGAEIYPGIWDEGAEALEYLLSYYDSLVRFYQQAAAHGRAVLLFLG